MKRVVGVKKVSQTKEDPLPTTRTLRPKSKTVTTKEVEESESDEGESDEEEENSKKKPSRALKKKVTEGKSKGVTTKKVSETTDESQYDENDSEDSGNKKKGKKRGKAGKGASDKQTPNKFKKGVWNPAISKLATTCTQKEDSDDNIHNPCCVKCVNKEVKKTFGRKKYIYLKIFIIFFPSLNKNLDDKSC